MNIMNDSGHRYKTVLLDLNNDQFGCFNLLFYLVCVCLSLSRSLSHIHTHTKKEILSPIACLKV